MKLVNEPESSFPCSQQPSTGSCTELPEPVHNLTHRPFKIRASSSSASLDLKTISSLKIFRSFSTQSSLNPPVSGTMGTGSFPGVKNSRGVTLTPHPLLVPWSRKSRAIPLLPLWAVRPLKSLSACTRVHLSVHAAS